MGDSVDDIIRVAALTMSEDQADRLIGWIALRTGRSKALATGDDTLHAQLGEQLLESASAAHRHHRGGDRRQTGRGTSRVVGGMTFGDLFEEVGDANLLGATAQIDGRLDGRADVVGVDVTVP